MNAAPVDGMQNLPADQQQKLLTKIDEMQVRDSLRMYNSLVDRCFRDCVESFRRKDLEKTEEKCVQSCCEKFIKSSARVGMRFAELSSQAEQEMAQILQSK